MTVKKYMLPLVSEKAREMLQILADVDEEIKNVRDETVLFFMDLKERRAGIVGERTVIVKDEILKSWEKELEQLPFLISTVIADRIKEKLREHRRKGLICKIKAGPSFDIFEKDGITFEQVKVVTTVTFNLAPEYRDRRKIWLFLKRQLSIKPIKTGVIWGAFTYVRFEVPDLGAITIDKKKREITLPAHKETVEKILDELEQV